jgi:hypothetical protein
MMCRRGTSKSSSNICSPPLLPFLATSAALLPQAPAASLTRPQLQALNEVLTSFFGPTNDGAAYLSDIMRELSNRGIQVSREAVVAVLQAASSAEYDEMPAEQRWSQRLIWDPTDESVCSL